MEECSLIAEEEMNVTYICTSQAMQSGSFNNTFVISWLPWSLRGHRLKWSEREPENL